MRFELSSAAADEIADLTMRQNLQTLRNRVDELGVAEPVITRQGRDRIAVQLPGVQDTAQAKKVLGRTAALGVARGGRQQVGVALHDSPRPRRAAAAQFGNV